METTPHQDGVTMPEEWLRQFRHRTEAKHLERLEGDLALLNELVVVGFTGKHWDSFEAVLIRYGFQVLKSWLITGLIYQRVTEKGFGRFLTRIRRDRLPSPEDAEEIASDTLVESIPHFKNDVLIPGLWKPEGGASLRTYFIGQCLMRIPKAMGRWSRNLPEELPLDPADVTLRQTYIPFGTPEEMLGLKIRLLEAKEEISQPTLEIAYLKFVEGWSHAEIAEILGVTIGAIESRLYRMRRAG